MARMGSVLFFIACLAGAHAAGLASAASEKEDMSANPIRRVVSLLQGIAKKIEAEGESSTQLFDKFMCSCKKQRAEAAEALADTQGKDPEMESAVTESQQKIAQLKLEIPAAKKDLSDAKAAIESGKEGRMKDREQYLSQKAELEEMIDSIKKGVDAISNGKASSLLQAQDGTKMLLLKAVDKAQNALDFDKDGVVSFLSNGENAPSGGEVVGILKTINEDYVKNLASVESDEVDSDKNFEELVSAKTRQTKALEGEIEKKTAQSGQLSVNIANMKAEMASAEAAKAANEKFAAELESSCNARVKENEKAVEARGKELVAIADTIKILNDDDALDLFKKTLPSPSLLQIQSGMAQQRAKALAIIRAIPQGKFAPQLDFLSLSLSGHTANFGKVIKMIDEMTGIMKQQAKSDAARVEYCQQHIDQAKDKQKGLKTKVSDKKHQIEEQEEIVATTEAEMQAAEKSIKSLDAAVRESTEQRKAEHHEHVESMSTNSAAKELLGAAKDRLNQFYNPKLAKDLKSSNLMQVSEHNQLSTKQACRNVINMLIKLIEGLDKEMLEDKLEEKNAQRDYERLLEDAAAKRRTYVNAITENEGTKAEAESSRVEFDEASKAEEVELMATAKYEMELHAECDWHIANADLIAKSRQSEVEQLKQAKDVLAGANLSLLQGHVQMGKHLRGGK